MIIVENITTKQQDFLSGHSNTISCIDVSRSGNLIASGQVTYMGFKVLYTTFVLACNILKVTIDNSYVSMH